MDLIRTIVVDDEAAARARVRDLLARRPDIEIAGDAQDGAEAIALIRAEAPQVMVLSIQMPPLDGFGVLDAIEPEHLPTVVFLTAHDTSVLQALEAHGLDYLVKPFSDERFEFILQQVCRLIPPRDGDPRIAGLVEARRVANAGSPFLEQLALKRNGRVMFLTVDEIDWIEACGVYVSLHASQTTHLYRSSIAQLLQRLDPTRFVRIHRSSVVNTDRIKELQPRSHGDYTIVLHDDTTLTMSRCYRSELETWLRQKL